MRKFISMVLALVMILSCVYVNVSANELVASTNVELYQLAPESQSLMESYVIKTTNDKLIVIDGGIDGAGKESDPYLPSALRAIAGVGEGEYFEVEAWFLSHAHEDHYYELAKMLNEYNEESNYKINNFYFDFPPYGKTGTIWENVLVGNQLFEELKSGLDNYAEVNEIEFDSETYYDELNGKVVNSTSISEGLDINIDDVRFEIMQTWDEADGTTELNNTSMILRMHAAGKSVLFLNDAYIHSGNRLVDTYGENLKSDYVQMAHHGQSGTKQNVYDAVQADFFLWPTPKWIWTNPDSYAIDDVRTWITGADYTEVRENDLVAGMYDVYPDDPTVVADWAEALPGMKITFTNEDANYTAPKANKNLKYTGEEQELVTEGSTDIGTMEYCIEGEDYADAIPTAVNAGEYTVYYRITDGSVLVEEAVTVTIAKVTPEFTAPVAKVLFNTGEEQELIEAGSVLEGEFLYSTDDVDYSAEIPTATESGNYTVYYKAEESENYLEISGSVNVTIGDYSVTFKNGNELAPFDEDVVMSAMDGECLVELPSYETKANTEFAYFKIGDFRFTEEELLSYEVTANTEVLAYFRETAITSCDYDFTTMTEDEFELTAFGTDSDFVLTEGVGIQLSKTEKVTYDIPLATDVAENALSVSYGFTETANTGGFDGHFKRGGDTVAIFYHTSNYMRVYADGAAQYIYNLGQLDDGVHHDVEFILDIASEKQYVVMDGFSGIVPTEGSHDLLNTKVPDRFTVLQKAGGSFILESFGVKRLEDTKIREVTLSAGDGVTGISFMNKAESATYTNTYIYMQEGDKVPLQATLSVGHELTGWSADSGSFSDETALKTVYTAGSNDATISAEGENALAAAGNVAFIGETGYKSLQEAADAATTGSTIYLLKDIEDSARVTFNKGTAITVDGNGYTYTDTGSNLDGSSTMLVQSNTHVTFKNITLKQTNLAAWKSGTACRRVNGFFIIQSGGKVIFSDKAVLDGAAGANGSVAWMDSGAAEFVLDGEGAAIRNADTTYGHGIIAAYNGSAKITIKNGTIENCTSTGGSILKARAGKSIAISGGTIINNTAKNGAVWTEGDGALTISGNAVIKDNITPSNIVDGKETGLLPLNVYLPAGTYIRVNSNFTGEVGVTSSYVQFAIASTTGLTGLDGFFHDGTSYTGRYYVSGTKYPNDTAKATIEARNAGKETAVIFDYPFAYAAEGEDFLKKGTPAEMLEDASKTEMIAYLLRDIGLSDVANKGASGSLGHYHVNIAAKDAVFTYDGNGFELKIADGNYTKKQHVFRLYNQVNATFRNFIYDGGNLMSFVNAEYVNASNLGGNLTLDNCYIKNCLKTNAGGTIIGRDGTITIKNTVIEKSDSSTNGGAIYMGTPKVSGGKSELIMENSIIKNTGGASGGAIDIQSGATATITGSTFEDIRGSNGGAIRVNGTLTMSDSTVKNAISRGEDTNGGGIMVWEAGSKATLTDVVIDSCTGDASGGVCVVEGTLELYGDTEIKNCHSAADNAGLWNMEGGTVIIGGNTKITDNTAGSNNIKSNITNDGTLTIAKGFAGNIGFTKTSTINLEEGLTSFAAVDSLTLDKDATKYPYITEENKINWELIPLVTVETDAGWYYKDNTYAEYASENPGIVRFLTTFTEAPSSGCIVNYGSYALGADTNEFGGINSAETLTENTDKITSGKSYIIDVTDIPADTEETIYGISFVTLKNIDTPLYFATVSQAIDANAKKLIKK